MHGGPSIEIAAPFQDLAESITAPRQQAMVMQPLDEILILCLRDVVSGCEGFIDIALHGQEKLELLRKPTPFENGIPSHDALPAVLRAFGP